MAQKVETLIKRNDQDSTVRAMLLLGNGSMSNDDLNKPLQ
jgi:hypothetical protein